MAVIGGGASPCTSAEKRKQLEERIKRHGFEQTMEALAYTWFNRLVAIRFMELHGYLDHGYRVLSHPEGKPTPEILEHAEHVELPGLKKETVIDLKLAGNKEAELYRLLLIAQCNALHTAMPFLFEKIDDETELLLPDNLLHSDSLIRKLVGEIDEEDWQEVEIIGWLYQFYISEKKDEVIGKVVASEDIPAATQLFTPNWIVKYLVQNTLGRQWLATYPQSALRQQMEYYIEPAEQTPEVQEQLKAITPTSLNPEELTLLDPACGSGHILVEAYDLFKAIYQERGYRAKDIPALILQKNLFGLEIDDRAAQLAAFALMMKARADDRRIFDSEAKPNILAFQDSQGHERRRHHPRPQLADQQGGRAERVSVRGDRGREGRTLQQEGAGREGPRLAGRHRLPAGVVRERQDVRLADPGSAEAGGEAAGDREAARRRAEARRPDARLGPRPQAAACSRLGCWHGSTTPWLRIRRTWAASTIDATLKGVCRQATIKDAKADLYRLLHSAESTFCEAEWLCRDDYDSELDVSFVLRGSAQRSLARQQTIDTFIHNWTYDAFRIGIWAVAALYFATQHSELSWQLHSTV